MNDVTEQQKEPLGLSRVDTPSQARRTRLFALGFEDLRRAFGGPPTERARAAVRRDLFGDTAPRAAG